MVYDIQDKPKFPLQLVLAILAVSFGKVTLTSIACALILSILTNVLVSRAAEE